jgi:argininosuccinate lyase
VSLLRGGRFGNEAHALMQRFASSLDVDLALVEFDLEGSHAHAAMLTHVGILSADEGSAIADGLAQIRAEWRAGRFVPNDSQEDIHMAIEARLTELIGAPGRKLHTARSRNDQVATAVRLWLKAALGDLLDGLRELHGVLLKRILGVGRTLMPGYTHSQRGQPIWLGHHLLAHVWALQRDSQRLRQALNRSDASPLGAGAMAGTPHPIDRAQSAKMLEFAGLIDNAMDAVSTRDYQIEAVAACATLMAQLSRMAEELVLWSGQEFRFVRLPDHLTSGSSIMPQKRNPDGAELIRGKCAGVFGDLQTLLSLVKNLPLAYNRDLQEDRRALMHALDTTTDSVAMMAALWRDFSLATEIADHLARAGVPFREGYQIAGAIVKHCEARGGNLNLLDRATAAGFHPLLDIDLRELLDPEQAVERRRSHGGTAWVEIERQVDALYALVGLTRGD